MFIDNTIHTYRLSLAESEIAMSESKLTEMGALLEIAKEEQTECGKTHHHELKREREVCLTDIHGIKLL